MKQTINDFLSQQKLAIAGASPNKDNFGKYLMQELSKIGKEVYPVNPRYQEIEGTACVGSVKELPGDVESLILAVPPALTDEIVGQALDSGIKRIWMIQGVGRGAYSESAHQKCRENNIEVVYGFCPMMLFGKGMHRFHFWFRKTFGKLPGEYQLAPE
jgi:predicted CoA-binding protein